MNFSFLSRWFSTNDSDSPANESLPKAGEAEAQFRTGLRNACGYGGAPDYPKAAEWYTLAAEQNHALAQFNLSVMYGQGQGVARDSAKSLMWMTRAAQLGDAGAQYKLGVQQYLEFRNGVPIEHADSRIEALKWVQLAAAQGYRGAEGACEYVALGMSREDVTEGARRVSAFGAALKA